MIEIKKYSACNWWQLIANDRSWSKLIENNGFQSILMIFWSKSIFENLYIDRNWSKIKSIDCQLIEFKLNSINWILIESKLIEDERNLIEIKFYQFFIILSFSNFQFLYFFNRRWSELIEIDRDQLNSTKKKFKNRWHLVDF